MAGEQIHNAKGEPLGSLSTYSISDGLNSPYPSEGSGTIPNMTALVATDSPHELLFEAGKDATLSGGYSGGHEELFSGRVSSVSTSDTSQQVSLGLDADARKLDQDITTFPIIGDDKYIVRNTLLHWFSECGVFRWDHPGTMELQIQNISYGIGYYNHPTKRLFGDYLGSTVAWVPTDSASVDNGIEFIVGDKLNFCAIFDLYSSSQPTQTVLAQFSNGADIEDETISAALNFEFNMTGRTIKVTETGNGTKTVLNLSIPASSTNVRVDCQAQRITNSRVVYTTRVVLVDGTGITRTYDGTYNSTTSSLPLSLRVEKITNTNSTAGLRGVDTFYIVRSDVQIASGEPRWGVNTQEVAEATIPSGKKPVVPGIAGNCWQLTNELCTLYGMMFNARLLSVGNAASWSATYGTEDKSLGPVNVEANVRELAETVEVVNYNYLYPSGPGKVIELWRADSTYNVGRGERQEHTIHIEGSFASLSQPVVVAPSSFPVYAPNKATRSLYSVYGADNTAVSPSEWESTGGFIQFEPTGVPGELTLVIQAPHETLTKAAPYTISVESTLPALTLVGVGVKERKETMTAYTGAGKVAKKVGTTYDSPLVCASWLGWNAASGLSVIHGTTMTEATGTYLANYSPEDLPPTKAYYIRKQGALYRMNSVTVSQSQVAISGAQRFVRCSDVNDEYAGLTCAQVNALFPGKDVNYNNLAPLRRYID